MVLLTIVCEERLIPPLVELLQRCGATGYTTSAATGLSFARRDAEQQRQIVYAVVPHEEADHILDEILQRDFHSESFVLWVSDVKVLRRGRFAR
ncbi:MAG: hypothetical protein N2663_07965 [Chlorobi bacterium]|nr:hypothetical protein [Chlorobiota bacterium]